MKTLLAVATIAVGMALAAPTGAAAQERLTDGALGAVAGGLVGGPVGAVAGGVIGYTAGPNIAHAMGLRQHRYGRNANGERGSEEAPH